MAGIAQAGNPPGTVLCPPEPPIFLGSFQLPAFEPLLQAQTVAGCRNTKVSSDTTFADCPLRLVLLWLFQARFCTSHCFNPPHVPGELSKLRDGRQGAEGGYRHSRHISNIVVLSNSRCLHGPVELYWRCGSILFGPYADILQSRLAHSRTHTLSLSPPYRYNAYINCNVHITHKLCFARLT